MHPISRSQAITGLCTAPMLMSAQAQQPRMQSWPLVTPTRTGIHDLAPAPDGGVWFSAQRSGHLGWFDPTSGRFVLFQNVFKETLIACAKQPLRVFHGYRF